MFLSTKKLIVRDLAPQDMKYVPLEKKEVIGESYIKRVSVSLFKLNLILKLDEVDLIFASNIKNYERKLVVLLYH